MLASSSPVLLTIPRAAPLDCARRLALLRLKVQVRDFCGLTRPLQVALVVETRPDHLAPAELLLHFTWTSRAG